MGAGQQKKMGRPTDNPKNKSMKITTTRSAGGFLSAYKAVGAGCAYWRIE